MGQEHRLGVLENRVLRGVYGTKRKDVKGGWREDSIKSSCKNCRHQKVRRW